MEEETLTTATAVPYAELRSLLAGDEKTCLPKLAQLAMADARVWDAVRAGAYSQAGDGSFSKVALIPLVTVVGHAEPHLSTDRHAALVDWLQSQTIGDSRVRVLTRIWSYHEVAHWNPCGLMSHVTGATANDQVPPAVVDTSEESKWPFLHFVAAVIERRGGWPIIKDRIDMMTAPRMLNLQVGDWSGPEFVDSDVIGIGVGMWLRALAKKLQISTWDVIPGGEDKSMLILRGFDDAGSYLHFQLPMRASQLGSLGVTAVLRLADELAQSHEDVLGMTCQ